MKNILLMAIIITIFGCKSIGKNSYFEKLDKTQTYDISNCIDNAQCSIEIIPNSNLVIKEDKFNNTYIEIEKGNNIIIKYHLKKDKTQNTTDSNYSEFLYLETDSSDKTIHLKDNELQQVKMVFGRLCYCKGTSGYFKVKKGDLELILKKNKVTLNTTFLVKDIPQIITHIHEKITL